MHSLGIIIFCLAVVHPFLCNGEVARRLLGFAEEADVDPILEHLRIKRENVIAHELIHINVSHNIHKRAVFGENPDPLGREMRFRAFGGDMKLWLYPKDSLFATRRTPVYFAYEDNSPAGVRYELQVDAMKKVGKLYEDPKHYASMVIGTDPTSHYPTITGNMRSRTDKTALVIRPLPEEVVEKHLRRRRSVSGDDYDSSLDSARHVALKVRDYFPNIGLGEVSQKVNVRGKSRHRSSSSKVSHSSVDYSHSIYPRILVELDSSYWGLRSVSGKKEELAMVTLLEYVLAFWNGVDLSFRHLENPGIRFHISGIAMAKTPGATPYILSNHTPPDSLVDSVPSTYRAKDFFFSVRYQIPLDTYHVAVTMTLREFRNWGIGASATGGACMDRTHPNSKEGVAMIHDDGVFDGVDTAAHEMGHSLGLKHDNQKRDDCKNSLNYIMGGDGTPMENMSMFSPCSLEEFNSLLERGELTCMYNPPAKTSRNLPKIAPGKFMNMDEQCRMLNYQKRCSWGNDNPCVAFSCTSRIETTATGPVEHCEARYQEAAPGSPCNDKDDDTPRFCIQRRCVAVNTKKQKYRPRI